MEEKGLGQATIQAEVFTFDLWYSFKSTITFFASFFFFIALIIVTFIFHRFHFFYGRFFLENNHVGIDYIARYVFLFNVFFFSSSSNDSRNNCIYIIDIQCGENLKPNYNKPKCLQYLSN